MDTALSMPVYQERLRVICGSVALEPSYLARIVALGDFPELVRRWDCGIRRVLQSVMPGVRITDRALSIASLPTALGGLGVPFLNDYADAAFVSSYINVSKLAHLVLSLIHI